MKLLLPGVDHVFDMQENDITEIIIENQSLMRSMLTDVWNQVDGLDGLSIISEDDKQLPINKYIEVIDRFIPFNINRKSLLTKITSEIEKRALEPDYYAETTELLSKIEKLLMDVSYELSNIDIVFENITVSSLIKFSGVSINEEYESLGEKLVDYMELVTEYDRRKLFLFVGLRSYLSDSELDLFVDTVRRRGYEVVLIEAVERIAINGIKRYIIDNDLCEIG